MSELKRSADKMNFNRSSYRIVVASDVSNGNDNIGVEIYRGEELLIAILRDDTKKIREIQTFAHTFTLEEMEGFIQIFRDSVPWDFVDYDNLFKQTAEPDGPANSRSARG